VLSKGEKKGKPHPGCPGHELCSVGENSARTQYASIETALKKISRFLCSFIFQIRRTASLIVLENPLNEKYFRPKIRDLVFYRDNTNASNYFHSWS
jgi:hypothetical protein